MGQDQGRWGKAKRAVGKIASIVVGLPAFDFGVLKGVVLEVKDLAVGVFDGIASVVKSIVSGSLLDDALALYRQIVHLPLRQLLGDLWRNFKGADKSIWERWSYRGEIVGRGIAMAVIAFFSGGSSLIASVGSRLAAFAAKLRELRLVSKLGDAITGKQRSKVEGLLKEAKPSKEPVARPRYRACFVAGTLVDAGDGAVAIEGLAAGDALLGQHAGEPTSAGRYDVLDAQRGRRKLTDPHAAYTPDDIREMGLRPDPSPGHEELAKAGFRHVSLRPKSAAVFDPRRPANKPPNELTPHERTLVVEGYERVPPGIRAKPKDLSC